MAGYMTKQRRVLLSFFESHPDEIFSALQIVQQLDEDIISISAVYRNLTALEEDGLLRRHAKSGAREVYYQYVACDHCKGRIHLSCTKCDKLFHISPDHQRQLFAQMFQLEGFYLDAEATVLYGICPQCGVNR